MARRLLSVLLVAGYAGAWFAPCSAAALREPATVHHAGHGSPAAHVAEHHAGAAHGAPAACDDAAQEAADPWLSAPCPCGCSSDRPAAGAVPTAPGWALLARAPALPAAAASERPPESPLSGPAATPRPFDHVPIAS
jgi:hypothetical protein